MTSATRTAWQVQVEEYAAAVRAALADVPADRSEELLDDLEEHLAEVAADGEGSLVSRLGPPADYARELRTAAGLAAGPTATDGPSAGAQLVDRLRSWEPVRQVERFLPELRPAWWVVRAWAAATAVDLVFVGGTAFPVPTLGLGPLGMLATAAAVAWSVKLGLRARAEERPAGRAAVVVNAGLGLLALIALVGLADRPDPAAAGTVYYGEQPADGLVHDDGTPITNILPYSSTGEPLTGVLLYDQDGRPIDDLSTVTAQGETVEPVPDAPLQPDNAFPQQLQVLTWDEYGEQNAVPMPLPMPTPATTTPATTTPATTTPATTAPATTAAIPAPATTAPPTPGVPAPATP